MRGNLRHAFSQCDVDGSGSISASEIEDLMKVVLKSLIETRVHSTADIDDLINGIATDILKISGKSEMNWLEFKKYFPAIEEKLESTQKFIREYL